MEEDDLKYSQEAAVAAITDYYAFLTQMYLDESHVVFPPQPWGWPSIANANIVLRESFGKSDEVLSLLAHLPYIQDPSGVAEQAADATPGCIWADWSKLICSHSDNPNQAKSLRVITEGTLPQPSPPHLVGLAHGGDWSTPILILDTTLGIIHWEGCPDRIQWDPEYRETMVDMDWYDAEIPEKEADWRSSAPAWRIADFVEVLKDQFRQLRWIPISGNSVRSTHEELPNEEGMMATLQDIYRQHGWPDLSVYRKSSCLDAVRKVMLERFSESRCYREG
ncbi:hypothetical protein VTJ49DRAFT_3609 [Mycothermus thermophilus]|uniref:Aminoglycoside phosphotransferase domain-containing protein n=1 Tax=Humicola insolens TaxID=85995 RepID=A0ABR3VMN9_HUMIN